MTALVEAMEETKLLWRDTFDAAFPYYEQYGRRCTSFTENIVVGCASSRRVITRGKMYALASNGFFYSGVDDIAICFQCGIALRNWNSVEDTHVHREHLYWYRGCSRYSNVTAAAAIAISHSPRTIPAIRRVTRYNVTSTRLGARYATLVNAGSVLRRELKSFGFFTNLVAEASNEIASTLELAVHAWERARAILECMSYHDENDAPHPHFERILIDTMEKLDVVRGRTPSSEGGGGGGDATTADCGGDGTIECAVCYSNRRNSVLLPCRHFVACDDCAGRLATCPLCRTAIWMVVSVKWG